MKAKLGINHGVAGAKVVSVAANTIVSSDLIDSSSTPFNPVGRVVSVIGRQSGSTPFASYLITAFNPATGAITTATDPSATVQAGDAIVIRNKADAGNSANPTEITDSGYKNVGNAYAGLTPGALVGALIRVIAGTGRGTPPRKITGNTATQINWDLPMVLDETSAWITEEAAWTYTADSTSMGNGNPLAQTTLAIPAANFTEQPVLIAGFTVDVNGNESPDGDAPLREDWIYGAQGTVLTVS